HARGLANRPPPATDLSTGGSHAHQTPAHREKDSRSASWRIPPSVKHQASPAANPQLPVNLPHVRFHRPLRATEDDGNLRPRLPFAQPSEDLRLPFRQRHRQHRIHLPYLILIRP